MICGLTRVIGERANVGYYKILENAGNFDPIKRDWDTLIILDACRPDVLSELVEWNIEVKRSPGTNSWGFMQSIFADRELHDTVYVSANPYTPRLSDNVFYAVESLLNNEWDEELQTVRPETVTDHALAARGEYPQKRLIVHYMQPHTPFIGPLGQQLGHNADFRAVLETHEAPPETDPIWHQLRRGETNVSIEEVRDAYRENLKLVLDEVKRLIEKTDEKIALMSDHGELMGERERPVPVRGFGHEYGLHIPELVNIPWVVFDAETRINTISEPPVKSTDIDKQVMNDRLKALGYK